MKITTIGIFPTKMEAEKAIEELKASGIADRNISCIYADKDGDMKDSMKGEKVGSGVARGAGTGAIVGAIAGLVVANGVFPGLGTLFVAGPLATALGLTGGVATTVAGAATGAVAGGLIGALTKLGIKREDAEMYENHLRQGEVLVITHTDSPVTANILSRYHADEVREYSEA
jgi:hypothetical protein